MLKLKLTLPLLLLTLLGPLGRAQSAPSAGCGLNPNCLIFAQSYYGRIGMFNPYLPQREGELIVTSQQYTPGASPFHPYLHDQIFHRDSQGNFHNRFWDGGKIDRLEYHRFQNGISR